MKRFKEKIIKKFICYCLDEKFFEISKKIIDGKYRVLDRYKDDGRTFVALIEVDKTKYILKEFQKEGKSLWKRLLTFFNSGEAYTVLKNTQKAKDIGIEEVTNVYSAIIKKRFGMVIRSYILMEYIPGEIKLDQVSIKKIESLMEQLHRQKIYHGDCNPYNFLFVDDNKIKIIDSKLKKDYIGNRIKHDRRTLKKYKKVKI